VRFDGVSLFPFFDASLAGVAPGLDLDAAHYLATDGSLLLSFDGSGVVGGISFDDEDVLRLDPLGGIWSMAFDASSYHAGWSPADLDALQLQLETLEAFETVFAVDTTTFAWTPGTAYQAVRGSFPALSSDIGSYVVDATFASEGTSLVDPAPPSLDEGFWYLFRQTAGCAFGTWQTAPGAEPERDEALP
jgi:hypothetical protein